MQGPKRGHICTIMNYENGDYKAVEELYEPTNCMKCTSQIEEQKLVGVGYSRRSDPTLVIWCLKCIWGHSDSRRAVKAVADRNSILFQRLMLELAEGGV